jgi:hypothetical protein
LHLLGQLNTFLAQWDFAPKYWQIGIWRRALLHVRPSAAAGAARQQ